MSCEIGAQKKQLSIHTHYLIRNTRWIYFTEKMEVVLRLLLCMAFMDRPTIGSI